MNTQTCWILKNCMNACGIFQGNMNSTKVLMMGMKILIQIIMIILMIVMIGMIMEIIPIDTQYCQVGYGVFNLNKWRKSMYFVY